MVEVIVIGAGLSGLACAHALVRAGREVLLLEGRPRIGGETRTVEVGDFLFESGPFAARAAHPAFEEVVRELGLERRVVRSRADSARWYALAGDDLHPFPRGAAELVRTPLLSVRGRLRALAEPVVVGRESAPALAKERDLRQFLVHRLGAEAGGLFAEWLARRAHGSAPDSLGAASAFPALALSARERCGVLRELLGAEPPAGDELASFHGGLSVLIDGFGAALERQISTFSPVAELARGPGGWRATLESGEALSAAQIVLAVPAAAAYSLLAMCAPERLELDELRTVELERITHAHLGLDGTSPLPGRGLVVLPSEGAAAAGAARGWLGAVFHSSLFPGRAPTGTVAVSCSYRSTAVEAVREVDLPVRAASDLSRALGRGTAPAAGRIAVSYVRTLELPRLGVGHAARMARLLARIERALPGMHLTGSYLGGIEVADRLAHARATAAAVDASQRPRRPEGALR